MGPNNITEWILLGLIALIVIICTIFCIVYYFIWENRRCKEHDKYLEDNNQEGENNE